MRSYKTEDKNSNNNACVIDAELVAEISQMIPKTQFDDEI
jgi:hypothetical protein